MPVATLRLFDGEIDQILGTGRKPIQMAGLPQRLHFARDCQILAHLAMARDDPSSEVRQRTRDRRAVAGEYRCSILEPEHVVNREPVDHRTSETFVAQDLQHRYVLFAKAEQLLVANHKIFHMGFRAPKPALAKSIHDA